MRKVREALGPWGIDEKKYSGHSFRIGAATAAGIEDSLIKTLGVGEFSLPDIRTGSPGINWCQSLRSCLHRVYISFVVSFAVIILTGGVGGLDVWR